MRRLAGPLLITLTAMAAACAEQTPVPSSAAAPSGLATTAGTQAKGRRVDTPVTSQLATGASYQVQGDGTDYVDGANGVSSIIQTSNTCCNDWLLDTSSSAHGIRVDFSDNSPGGQNPFATNVVSPSDGGIIVQCHIPYPAAFPGMTTTGGPYLCPMVVHFHSSDTVGDGAKTYWKVAIGGPYYPNAPGSGLATVNCLQDSPGGCTKWSITGNAQQATLQRIAVNGTMTSFGNFVLSFDFLVSQ